MTEVQPPHFDVIIIGAGPAGSVAATILARAKFNVAIIEQSRFPRDKVCGECLSALGISVLRQNNLLSRLQQHSPAKLTRALIHAGDGPSIEMPLPRPMLGISRTVMDVELLQAARTSGAVIYQPARVEKIDGETGSIQLRDHQSNRVMQLKADLFLLADGKGALASRPLALTGDLGIKCHLRGIDAPRDAIELFGVDGHYTGLAPIEDDLWNLAFSIPSRRVATVRGNLDQLFDRMCVENKALNARLRNANRAGEWQACQLPRFPVAATWEKNVIPLGNAAAALEPIGGEGMGLAMRSAELACAEVIDARSNSRPLNVSRLREEFQSLWRVRRLACRTAAMIISRPRAASMAMSFLNHFPQLHQPAMKLVGKA